MVPQSRFHIIFSPLCFSNFLLTKIAVCCDNRTSITYTVLAENRLLNVTVYSTERPVGSDKLTARSTHCASSAVLPPLRPAQFPLRYTNIDLRWTSFRSLIKSVFVLTFQTVLSPYNRIQATVSRSRRSCLRTTVSNNSVSIQTVLSPCNRIQATVSRSRLSCLRTTVSKQQCLDPDGPVSVQPYPSNSVSIQTVLSPYNRIQATVSRSRLSCLRTTVSKQQCLDPDCPVSVQPYPSNSVSIQTVLSPYNRTQATVSRSRLSCLRTTVSKKQRLEHKFMKFWRNFRTLRHRSFYGNDDNSEAYSFVDTMMNYKAVNRVCLKYWGNFRNESPHQNKETLNINSLVPPFARPHSVPTENEETPRTHFDSCQTGGRHLEWHGRPWSDAFLCALIKVEDIANTDCKL